MAAVASLLLLPPCCICLSSRSGVGGQAHCVAQLPSTRGEQEEAGGRNSRALLQRLCQTRPRGRAAARA